MKPNVSFNPGQNCTFSTFPPAFKCSFWPGLLCTFSPPIPWREGGIFQMFFFNPDSLHLLTSACGEGGGFHMFFLNSGSLYLLTSACGEGGGILNVPFKPQQIVSFHLCLRGGGGGSSLTFPVGLHNVLIHSFYPSHNLLLLLLNPFLWKSIKYSIFLFQLDKARVQ